MLRFLLWRVFGVVVVLATFPLIVWFLHGGIGRALRGTRAPGTAHPGWDPASAIAREASSVWRWAPLGGVAVAQLLVALALAASACLILARGRARRRRLYVRLRVEAYRTDRASAEAVVQMFEALHKRLLRRWWRRLLGGQPSVALEVHYAHAERGVPRSAWLAISCPAGAERIVEATLRGAYPNCCLCPASRPLGSPAVLRLKKHAEFIKRVKVLDRFEHERAPGVNRLMTVMDACGRAAFVQMAVTPTPAFFEALAKRLYKHHERRLARERRDGPRAKERSLVENAELVGGLGVQHRPLFFTDLRVVAPDRATCERIASELRAEGAENRLVERGTAVRHGLFGLYARRVQRGEGNPLPSAYKGVFASTELAAVWHLPSTDYSTVPFTRAGVPFAPAAPAILRPGDGQGTLRDALGPVAIHPELRKQNTAVPGTVEQGKSSYLVASVAEDLRRERCAVIVLDPKGDAAEAAVGLVPAQRTCTLLDFSRPTCGFNPLAVDAPADVIADYVVGALKNLFSDADIRASSDRYLRNAIIAVLAYDPDSTLWDAARLLSVGEEGYAYRSRVAARVRTLPEFKEISAFFTAELSAQLADARSTTTAKLDAPVNKLARLLNSPSIKRVLLNDSLRVDFDRVIAHQEVLVVKGALGVMGAGNTSVLMQLLVGMLDAALARQQDLVAPERRVTVALKVDEAPLVLNRGFAETMALKRSAGLETVACWQTEAQWIDREVRDQLDALFAHRVYFATASTRDARAAVELTMAEFSDAVRPGIPHLATLGHPDARLHLPKHHAIASWSTPEGRQAPFVGQTIPLRIDRGRLELHAACQAARGGCYLADLRQPHWDRERSSPAAQRPQRGTAGPQRDGEQQREEGSRREGRPPHEDEACEIGPGRGALSRRQPECVGEIRWQGARGARPATPDERSVGAASSGRPPESYRELVELDRAHSVRWAKRVTPRPFDPEPLDVEILVLVTSLRHVLTSQIHRRFNPHRAATTTQRRLKRLSDAGWVQRFQFHRADGGGVPMCYVITAAGLELLVALGRSGVGAQDHDAEGITGAPTSARGKDERRLRQARHEVHVAGWVLALESALGGVHLALQGPKEAVISPPLRATREGHVALGPGDLRLPGGRTPHDFLRTGVGGENIEVQRFETVRPDAVVAVPGAGGNEAIDVIVELDDRPPTGRAAAKLERYDHFLAGWSLHTARYGARRKALPMVVFVCRDRARARDCARRADAELRASRAYAGEYPCDWEYPGRDRVLYVAERDAHEGLLRGYGVPRLPPAVRAQATGSDPRAQMATAEVRGLLPADARR